MSQSPSFSRLGAISIAVSPEARGPEQSTVLPRKGKPSPLLEPSILDFVLLSISLCCCLFQIVGEKRAGTRTRTGDNHLCNLEREASADSLLAH